MKDTLTIEKALSFEEGWDPKPGTFPLGPKDYPYFRKRPNRQREQLYEATLTGDFKRIETEYGTLSVTLDRSHEADYALDAIQHELRPNHIEGTKCWWTPQGWEKFGKSHCFCFSRI